MHCRALISFTQDRSQPVWVGFSLAAAMFLTATAQSFALNHYFMCCFVTGLRLRSSLIAAIYKKVLQSISMCHTLC